MASSPAATPFITRIENWVTKLGGMQDIFDAWMLCQQKWMFLGPVYGSEEIAKQVGCVGGCCESLGGGRAGHLRQHNGMARQDWKLQEGGGGEGRVLVAVDATASLGRASQLYQQQKWITYLLALERCHQQYVVHPYSAHHHLT